MNIQVKQDAIYAKKDWWKWSVWVDGPDKELDQINFVEYTLHPTFPNLVRQKMDRDTKFRLESAGWGGFTIYLAVHLKSEEVLNLKHLLVLSYPETSDGRKAAVRGEDPRKTTVYLVSGSADAPLADVLRNILIEQGLQILTSNDVPSGISFQRWLMKVLDQVDMAVAVISDRSSYWVLREVEYLKERGMTVIPVIVGSVSTLPPEVSDLQVIYIGEGSTHQDAAREVVEQIMKVRPS